MATLDILHRPEVERAAKPARRPRQPLPLPMIALGLVAVLSVGFGAGSLIQFDQDWRGSAPVALASVSQPLATADLPAELARVLAGTRAPVSDVNCTEPSGLQADAPVLCRAHSKQGMVSVIAEPLAGQQYRVTVFLSQ